MHEVEGSGAHSRGKQSNFFKPIKVIASDYYLNRKWKVRTVTTRDRFNHSIKRSRTSPLIMNLSRRVFQTESYVRNDRSISCQCGPYTFEMPTISHKTGSQARGRDSLQNFKKLWMQCRLTAREDYSRSAGNLSCISQNLL